MAARLPPASVLRHVVDVHCHPTDAPHISDHSMENLPIVICAMSTTQQDQSLVEDLASRWPEKVVPCFGYHPWFTHTISLDPKLSKYDHYRSLFLNPTSPDPSHITLLESLLPSLPIPCPLSSLLDTLRRMLSSHPNALLGEVGLDRSFRIARDYNVSPRVLTPFTIPISHQLAILEAQLDVAVELGRCVSMHSVKCQAITMELLSKMDDKWKHKWREISVDMHSCGFSAQMWTDMQKLHNNVFLSLSTVINSRSPAHRLLIAACLPTRILVESDFNNVDYCAERTWDMVLTVADVKGWHVEDVWDDVWDRDEEFTDDWGVVRRLEANWKVFLKGSHPPRIAQANRKERRPRREYPEPDSDKGDYMRIATEI